MGVSKRSILPLAVLAFICCICFVYNQLNDGFSMGMLRSTIPYYPEFDLATEEDREQIALHLEQKFYYLGKGCQFYVFESEDGLYVLKFPKHKHLRAPYKLLKLPIPSYLKYKLQQMCEKKEFRVKKLFSSCLLGYEQLRGATGLEFIHLNRKSCFDKRVTLVDKLGVSHSISIDQYEFIIQKRAIDSRLYFKKILSQHDETLIRYKLQQLIDLVLIGNSKNIVSTDRAFFQNVGFTPDGSQALLLDVGQLVFCSSDERAMEEELQFRLHNMRCWAIENAEELVSYVDELAAKYRLYNKLLDSW
jgi:hypothetical protein